MNLSVYYYIKPLRINRTLVHICIVISEIEVVKSGEDKIYNVLLDPTGKHIVISMHSADNYYLSYNSKKPRLLSKLKVILHVQNIFF